MSGDEQPQVRSLDLSLPRLSMRKLGELRMEGEGKLSAASGLVSLDDQLFVVPDDGLSLGCFETSLSRPGKARPVFRDAPLPEDHAERKKAKPDLESLTLVPSQPSGQTGPSLLSVGSGSSERRQRGVLVPVEGGEPLSFDLTPLYQELSRQLSDLNIEGVAIQGQLVRMVHRGNSAGGTNALIDLDAARFFGLIAEIGAVGPEALQSVRAVDLGELSGVKLTFTDLAPAPDGHFVFTASAENTDNPYDDGAVLGSVLGRMDRDGTVRDLRLLDGQVKVEGVDVAADGQVRLVTDAAAAGEQSEVEGEEEVAAAEAPAE
ncbi:hypothetical protein DYH09_14885 [bacterium CPR1]|nr:hypothetical protein [bacterium CPR1]